MNEPPVATWFTVFAARAGQHKLRTSAHSAPGRPVDR
jgi:hypothetical protein